MFEWLLYNTRMLFRGKDNLFFSLVFPVALVFVLGNMLAAYDNPDSAIGTLKIAYSVEWESEAEGAAGGPENSAVPGNSENGEAAGSHMKRAAEAEAVRLFVDALSEYEGVELTKAKDAAAARAEVGSGGADVALLFETPLGISVAEGEDIIKNRAAMLIARGFAREYAAYAAAAANAPEAFGEAMKDGVPDFSYLTADKDLGIERTMLDYYAVTMIVMIIFMSGGTGGASGIFLARQDGSLRRMTASPRGRSRLFLEAVFGVVPQNIMQALIVMVLSAGLMGAHYARTWQENIALFAFFILLGTVVTALFMLVGLFIRVNPYMPIMAVMWALLFMSGSFSKDIYIEGFSEYLPMNIVQRAVFDLTLFGRSGMLMSVALVCAALLAVSCAAGSALFRRKEIMF